MTKVCRVCEKEKDSSEFNKNSSGGLMYFCRKCQSIYNAKRYQERKSAGIETPEFKRCATCFATQSSENFQLHALTEDGLLHECNDCRRDRHYARTYGITLEEYDKMDKEQNRRCAICLEFCITGRRLAIDHDHKTGRVRGLLCAKCNRALGMFGDSPQTLQRAIEYLKEESA